ncbi:MAG TPA: arginase family protein [Polyangiaceae bacterium]|nr:arginase family protein [Polyangiaceae bacterium]
MARRGRPGARDKQREPPVTARATPDAAARHAREAREAVTSEREKSRDRPASPEPLTPAPRPRAPRFAPLATVPQRSAGIASFLRLPVSAEPSTVPSVDVLLTGVPFDSGSAFRPGARFGPRAVREASALSSSFSGALGVDVFRELDCADGGDIVAPTASVPQVLDAVAEATQAIAGSGVIPGFVGGDRTLTLGALRGLRRAKHKALGLLLIGAHPGASSVPEGEISAANFLRHAVTEGLVRTDCSMQVGLRGPYPGPDELSFAFSHGIDTVGVDEVRWDLHAVVSQVRRLVQKGAVYVSVDLGALDPAYAPGASFPVPGGMTTWDLQQILRALVGAEIVGFDVVELAPDYDPLGISALAGVSVLHEILAAMADTRRSAHPAPSTHRSGRAGRRSA